MKSVIFIKFEMEIQNALYKFEIKVVNGIEMIIEVNISFGKSLQKLV